MRKLAYYAQPFFLRCQKQNFQGSILVGFLFEQENCQLGYRTRGEGYNGNEDKQVYVCSKRLVCISCEVVYEKSETRLDERVCVFVTTKEGRVTNK